MIDAHVERPTTSNAALPSQGGQLTEPTRDGGESDTRDTEENIGMNKSGEAVFF